MPGSLALKLSEFGELLVHFDDFEYELESRATQVGSSFSMFTSPLNTYIETEVETVPADF